ncbi:cytochrome P450 [Pleomassaria siparia CBS 279.74]|uniref:Cytochrome P450 n=1 Tax=Pleomassaria siparia CBS 279.74 TaxID=1314801 RepID=A0A6G1KMS6_9PLEO|nr:cytochrome P450 [Pleomassaria siparia CBS 279.74]
MAHFPQSTQWETSAHSKLLSASLGLLSHLVLNSGEWDHSSHLVASFWIITFGAFGVAEYTLDPNVNSVLGALMTTSVAAAVYFGALLISILIYRAFFHRLRKFPGPFGNRLSKLYNLKNVIPDFRYYEQCEILHKRYNSDYVRTGPRELSIISADAISAVHGPLSRCRKGPFYSGAKHIEGYSIHTERNRLAHKERRKAWDHALTAKSLRDYEPRLNRHAYALMDNLKQQSSKPSVPISEWVNFYSFDAMGDIGFNRTFGMMEKGKEDELITMLHASMAPLSIMGHVNWFGCLVLRTIGSSDMMEFMGWTSKVLRERKRIEPKEKDIMGHLLDPNDEHIPLHLNADARLLIVAGSDTTSATLTWLFYELCKNPSVFKKLQKIVDDIAPGKSFLDVEDLDNCPYLDGVVHEALRLHPAVPSGVQRETPPEGITLPDQTYIPGETIIWMPPHVIQRDPRSFPSPLEFMPERWTSEAPEFIANKRAFITFGHGIYKCVGQKLALLELRSVTANLVRCFDMKFAEGTHGENVLEKTTDSFTIIVGRLDVQLTRRDL